MRCGKIFNKWSVRIDYRLIGILAFKRFSIEHSLIKIENITIELTTVNLEYSKHELIGEAILIFKSDKVQKYRFPKFTSEKFVPEAYLYYLFDQ